MCPCLFRGSYLRSRSGKGIDMLTLEPGVKHQARRRWKQLVQGFSRKPKGIH